MYRIVRKEALKPTVIPVSYTHLDGQRGVLDGIEVLAGLGVLLDFGDMVLSLIHIYGAAGQGVRDVAAVGKQCVELRGEQRHLLLRVGTQGVLCLLYTSHRHRCARGYSRRDL